MGNYMWRDEISTSWIYHNATLGLISLSTDWNTWITIADKNLWATTAWHDGDTLSQSNCWNYYQWWNNYAFPFAWASSWIQVQVDASNYWPNNYYSSSDFYYADNMPEAQRTWDSSNNKNLRWDITDTDSARKWPCPNWFHIMSFGELWALRWAWQTITWKNYQYDETNMKTYLLMPPAWQIWRDSYTPRYQWSYFWYRASSPADNAWFSTKPYSWMWIWTDGSLGFDTFAKCCWFNIRPMANYPVIPSSSRDVLYPNS